MITSVGNTIRRGAQETNERDGDYRPRYKVKKKGFYLFGKSILTMQVSSSSPWRSVQDARSQRWSWDKQYPTKSTLYFWLASPKVSPSSVCLSLMGASMNGGEYSWIGLGLCNKVNTISSRYIQNYFTQKTPQRHTGTEYRKMWLRNSK